MHPISAWLDGGSWHAAAHSFFHHFAFEAARYLIAVLVVWTLVHGVLRRRLAHRLISHWPAWRDVKREAMYSLSTLAVFAALGVGMFVLVSNGQVTVYQDPDEYGQLWLWASLPALLLWHDAYFYWTHRLLHTRWWYRHVHEVHHRSIQPSPWAAYAFHPLEALINGLVIPLAVLTVPLHVGVLFAFGVHQVLRNAIGHAAVEVMPGGMGRHWLGRHITTTTHHHLHHETAVGNYGLWFTWWDRWCGTEDGDYLRRLESAGGVQQPKETHALQRLGAQPHVRL